MENIVLLNMLVLGSIALVAAVILYVVSKKFAVKENPKIAEIEELLPQANCGGCGKAGCHDFADACAGVDEAGFPQLFCPVGRPGRNGQDSRETRFSSRSQRTDRRRFTLQRHL